MRSVYLDNAATTQIAPEVLDDMVRFERDGRGNPHRGLHAFAGRATIVLEAARTRVSSFIGGSDELIFTKSTTEGLNLAIMNLTRGLGAGDEVVLTIFDHHATLLPLYEASKRQGFVLRTIGSAQRPTPAAIVDDARAIIGPRTKLVVFPHVSNVLGTVLPAKELVEIAKSVGAKVLIDGAQAVGHMNVDVGEIGCDAYAFSAHKMYGPMGIGALYVKRDVLKGWSPMMYGGGMIEEVERVKSKEESNDIKVRYLTGPRLFEAGTPNVTGAFGFMAACHYVDGIGRTKIQKEESELARYLIDRLSESPSITIHPSRGSIVSFSVRNMHPHDVAQGLSDHGVMVRAGNHCAAPLAQSLDPAGTVRVSVGVTTTRADIDYLIDALKEYV